MPTSRVRTSRHLLPQSSSRARASSRRLPCSTPDVTSGIGISLNVNIYTNQSLSFHLLPKNIHATKSNVRYCNFKFWRKKNKINMRIKMCSISVEKKKQNCNTILPSVQWQCITQRLDANLHASDVPSTSSGDFKGDQYKPQLEYGLWVASMYMPLLLWKPRPLISRM